MKEQAIRFLFVGILNTLFGYATFSLFIFLGLHYAVASLFSIFLSLLFNFKTSGTLVFKQKNRKLFLKFMGVYAVIYFLKVCFIGISKAIFVPNVYLMGLCSYVLLAPLSFLMQKFIVFKERPTS